MMAVSFPAYFLLAMAMNPCPCGYLNSPIRECICTPPIIQRYLMRVSGPVLDRIDIHIEVPVSPSDVTIASSVAPLPPSNRVLINFKLQDDGSVVLSQFGEDIDAAGAAPRKFLVLVAAGLRFWYASLVNEDSISYLFPNVA